MGCKVYIGQYYFRGNLQTLVMDKNVPRLLGCYPNTHRKRLLRCGRFQKIARTWLNIHNID